MFGFSSFSSLPFSTVVITITPTPPSQRKGGDDAWTPEERKRYKKLQKKIAEFEKQRLDALKNSKNKRKQGIADLIDPPKVGKHKQNKVESNQEVISDIPSLDLAAIDRSIAYLQGKQEELLKAVAFKEAQFRIAQELAILEAKRLAELDDEEALLLLL
jgi:hypothetical protein